VNFEARHGRPFTFDVQCLLKVRKLLALNCSDSIGIRQYRKRSGVANTVSSSKAYVGLVWSTAATGGLSALMLAALAITQFVPPLNDDVPGFIQWIMKGEAGAQSLLEWILPSQFGALFVILTVAVAVELILLIGVARQPAGKVSGLILKDVLRGAVVGAAGGVTLWSTTFIFNHHWNGWLSVVSIGLGLMVLLVLGAIVDALGDV
jgi:hypothetical protein